MKKACLLLGCLFLVFFAEAQFRRKSSALDKFYFGGGLGASFGTNFTSISASPLVGYRITDNWSAGVRLTYQYVDQTVVGLGNSKVNFNNYGGALFTRYVIAERYFAHVEYESLSFEFPTGTLTPDGDVATERDGNNALFLGGGFREPLGGRASFSLTALYNVLWEEGDLYPYASPIVIRAGFAVGF